jgi:ribosomal protein S6--L-glutamate ligase
MNIAIVSRGRRLYSTRRLREACESRGHEVQVLDPLRFSMVVDDSGPDLFYGGKPVADFDAVVPRIGASITFYGCAVIRQFEQMGVFCVTTANSISVSRDKLRSIQILSRHDLGLASTAFVRQPEDVLPAIEQVGGAPVIIKLLEGTQGVGVILADSPSVARAIVETLQSAKQNVLIQAFVKESRGRDIRAFVVGDRVVAAMRRVAQGDEFRSNVHRGGRTEAVVLEPAYERAARIAARSYVLGLRVAGVDILETSDGPKIMEVNSSPGLEGIESATGVDLATAIVELIEQEVSFLPDIDVRHRLALSSGYGLIELSVDEDSNLAHRTLRETCLREKEILILTIQRGGHVIPSPKDDQAILPGDVLLCYGQMVTLKGLAPSRRPARVPRKRAEGIREENGAGIGPTRRSDQDRRA